MLNNKISVQTKLFLFVLNIKTTVNINISNEFIFGLYSKKFLFDNNILKNFMLKFIKIIHKFNFNNQHILLIFAENVAVYFILQLTNLFLKKQRKISLINEHNWTKGCLKNANVFKKQILKKKKFDLLVGFNFKPEIAILFGLTNNFIIKDLIYFNLPLIIFNLKQLNFNFNKNYYLIPSLNICENIIFIFIIKYSFLHLNNGNY